MGSEGSPSWSAPPPPVLPPSESSQANSIDDDADSRTIQAFVDGTPEPLIASPMVSCQPQYKC